MGKIMCCFFLIFGYSFSKCAFLKSEVFFLPSGWLFNQLYFSGAVCIYKIHFDEAFFPLNYQNVYGHQSFQGGDMLRGALTHKHA